jgi:hypothetical protein
MHWTHYNCEKLRATEIAAIEQENKKEYQCKICKAKIKGAIQTSVTKDVDLAREILDEEQDIAIDCRSDELDTCSVCNNISNKQTLEYNDDNPTCIACIGNELLQLNSEISTTQNREDALEKAINEQPGLKTTVINNTQEYEPKLQANTQQQSTPKQRHINNSNEEQQVAINRQSSNQQQRTNNKTTELRQKEIRLRKWEEELKIREKSMQDNK